MLVFVGLDGLYWKAGEADGGLIGGFAFVVTILLLYLEFLREMRPSSAKLAMLLKYGKVAEATVTNRYERELVDNGGDSTFVPCYECTFQASLPDGAEIPIRTKFSESSKKRPRFSVGQMLNVRYAPHQPSLCCLERPRGPLLPVQRLGIIVLVSGLIALSMTLWGIRDIISASAAHHEYHLSSITDWPQLVVDVARTIWSHPVGRRRSELMMFLVSFGLMGYALCFIWLPSLRKLLHSDE
jgi:hypothetical protein